MRLGDLYCQQVEKAENKKLCMNCAKCPFIQDNKWKYCREIKLGTQMFEGLEQLKKNKKIDVFSYQSAKDILNKEI